MDKSGRWRASRVALVKAMILAGVMELEYRLALGKLAAIITARTLRSTKIALYPAKM